jgi:hypothetical protein
MRFNVVAVDGGLGFERDSQNKETGEPRNRAAAFRAVATTTVGVGTAHIDRQSS